MRFGIGGTDPLYDGARIHLESQHGGCVRVTEDNEVDGSGKLDCRSFFVFLYCFIYCYFNLGRFHIPTEDCKIPFSFINHNERRRRYTNIAILLSHYEH